MMQRLGKVHDGRYATSRQLDRCIKALEQKLDAQVDQMADALDAKIDDIAAVLSQKAASAIHRSGNNWCNNDGNVHARFGILDQKIQKIADAAGMSKHLDSKDEDRKRLMERLKEAMKVELNESVTKHIKEPWMEYIFGICKPDGRSGKSGSRFVPASSNLRKVLLNKACPAQAHPPTVPLHAR